MSLSPHQITTSLSPSFVRVQPRAARELTIVLLPLASHFVIECFSSAWRVLASKEKGSALDMSPPQRVIFPREAKWRDGSVLSRSRMRSRKRR